ncbi:MAG: multidrug ABC transporter ATP-binding protein, partial [Ruminiclostridium sp.]
NSLDSDSAREVRALISELNISGTTVVLASHISEDIETLCTRIFSIENTCLTELNPKGVTL